MNPQTKQTKLIKIAVSNYKTGEEIWRGEVDEPTWERYQQLADKDTGACKSSVFFDNGLLTGQNPPDVIFAERI